MSEVSPEQFKINHLNQRIAAIVIDYEDKIANLVINNQVLRQERESLQQQIQELTAKEVDDAFDITTVTANSE